MARPPCLAPHDVLKSTPALWASLESVGIQPTTDDDGRPMELQLKNCSCGSTLAIEVRS